MGESSLKEGPEKSPEQENRTAMTNRERQDDCKLSSGPLETIVSGGALAKERGKNAKYHAEQGNISLKTSKIEGTHCQLRKNQK